VTTPLYTRNTPHAPRFERPGLCPISCQMTKQMPCGDGLRRCINRLISRARAHLGRCISAKIRIDSIDLPPLQYADPECRIFMQRHNPQQRWWLVLGRRWHVRPKATRIHRRMGKKSHIDDFVFCERSSTSTAFLLIRNSPQLRSFSLQPLPATRGGVIYHTLPRAHAS